MNTIVRKARELQLSLFYGRKGLPVSVNGTPLRILPQYRCFFPAEHDPEVAAFLRQRIRPGDTVFNVGANLGIYALQFSAWGASVVAFEPNPDTASVLRRHVALNNARIRVVEAAVSSSPGRATFHVSGISGMSRLGEPNPELQSTEAVSVEVTTLDQFCREEKLSPAWILIDIEGFEPAAIEGCRELLSSHSPPSLVVEFHPNAWGVAGSGRDQFETLLNSLHLVPVPLTGQSDQWSDYGIVCLKQQFAPPARTAPAS